MNRDFIKTSKRIVIKLGTSSIMKDKKNVDYPFIDRLAFVLSSLQQAGKDIILVSSGAIGVGASMLQLPFYPETLPEQQAISSVGQSQLMTIYSRFFGYYNQNVGQILMTKDIIDFPESYNNVNQAINKLLEYGIIPIINENDAVSLEELNHQTKFGDNDTLSAIVAENIDADLLIILSDVDGLYTANPHKDPQAKKLNTVTEINDEIIEMASGKGSEFATGGMMTKLHAAEMILENNQSMIISRSKNPTEIFDILEGQEIGTLFTNKNKGE